MVEAIKTEDMSAVAEETVKSENTTTDTIIKTSEDVKSENTTTDATLKEMKIIRQVEYYFGNVNLWRDKFLKEKVKEDDGWVTLECLITFNRLQSLSVDFDEIATALAKSKTGLLEIHEDKLKIRRSTSNPLPDPEDPVLRKASKMKTLYMKGFPKTHQLDDVQDFILSQGCQNIFIKMKLDEEKNFKGSVIVELATMEEAEKLLKGELKCGETTLTVMRRDEYFAMKSDKRHGNKFSNNKRQGGDDSGDADSDAKKPREDGDEKEEAVPSKLGCVLHFKGCGAETSREDLKTLFGEHETIEWVDFERGDTQGYIRFAAEGGAQRALDAVKSANEDKVVVKEKECETKVIEGIEEKNYWILVNEEKKRAKNNRFGGGRGGRGRGRGRGNRRGGKGEEWRKRRRPWEHENKKSEDGADTTTKNEHIKFEDGDSTTEKKAKVEDQKPASVEA